MFDINQSLARAWKLFNQGNYHDAEDLYLQCYKQIEEASTECCKAVLMGLLYTETYLEKFDDARNYGNMLLSKAQNEEDRHIAIHQLGMIERMAGNYPKAKALFLEEERLLSSYFPDDPLRMSANLYEQGYIALKTCSYVQAENVMRMSLDCSIRAADDMCIGCSYRGLGEIMIATGQKDAARECFRKATDAFVKAGDLIAAKELKSAIHSIEG